MHAVIYSRQFKSGNRKEGTSREYVKARRRFGMNISRPKSIQDEPDSSQVMQEIKNKKNSIQIFSWEDKM
jgi:hypothetical protein